MKRLLIACAIIIALLCGVAVLALDNHHRQFTTALERADYSLAAKWSRQLPNAVVLLSGERYKDTLRAHVMGSEFQLNQFLTSLGTFPRYLYDDVVQNTAELRFAAFESAGDYASAGRWFRRIATIDKANFSEAATSRYRAKPPGTLSLVGNRIAKGDAWSVYLSELTVRAQDTTETAVYGVLKMVNGGIAQTSPSQIELKQLLRSRVVTVALRATNRYGYRQVIDSQRIIQIGKRADYEIYGTTYQFFDVSLIGRHGDILLFENGDFVTGKLHEDHPLRPNDQVLSPQLIWRPIATLKDGAGDALNRQYADYQHAKRHYRQFMLDRLNDFVPAINRDWQRIKSWRDVKLLLIQNQSLINRTSKGKLYVYAPISFQNGTTYTRVDYILAFLTAGDDFYEMLFSKQFGMMYRYHLPTLRRNPAMVTSNIYTFDYSGNPNAMQDALVAKAKSLQVDGDAEASFKRISQYIIDRVTYSDDVLAYDNHTASKAFTTGEGVCESYASMATIMLNAIDIPTEYLAFYDSEQAKRDNDISHAYNRIKLDGEWRYFDLTWADAEGAVRKRYLNFAQGEHDFRVPRDVFIP